MQESVLGGPFETTAPDGTALRPDDIRTWLEEAGDGGPDGKTAKGVVIATPKDRDSASHTFIVFNRGGKARACDAQNLSGIWAFPGDHDLWQPRSFSLQEDYDFTLLKVHDPTVSVLDVDLNALGKEAVAVMDHPEFLVPIDELPQPLTHQDLMSTVLVTEFRAVRMALDEFSRNGYPKAPEIAAAVEAGRALMSMEDPHQREGALQALGRDGTPLKTSDLPDGSTAERINLWLVPEGLDQRQPIVLVPEENCILTKVDGRPVTIDIATGHVRLGVPAGREFVAHDIAHVTPEAVIEAARVAADLEASKLVGHADPTPVSVEVDTVEPDTTHAVESHTAPTAEHVPTSVESHTAPTAQPNTAPTAVESNAAPTAARLDSAPAVVEPQATPSVARPDTTQAVEPDTAPTAVQPPGASEAEVTPKRARRVPPRRSVGPLTRQTTDQQDTATRMSAPSLLGGAAEPPVHDVDVSNTDTPFADERPVTTTDVEQQQVTDERTNDGWQSQGF